MPINNSHGKINLTLLHFQLEAHLTLKGSFQQPQIERIDLILTDRYIYKIIKLMMNAMLWSQGFKIFSNGFVIYVTG